MFDTTLLDSSPKRVPVLGRWHWVGSFAVGMVGGLAGYLILPFMFNSSPEGRVVESLLLGVAVMFYELMLWYVLADARQLGLNAGRWSIVLLVLNVAGFVTYLVYSAIKTGDWKRAALPIAYMLEGAVVCILLLVPLIYTQALPDAKWTLATIPPPRLGTHAGAAHVKPAIRNSAPIDTTVRLIFPQPFKPHTSGREEANAAENLSELSSPGIGDGNEISGVPYGQIIGIIIPLPPKPEVKPETKTRIFASTKVQEAKLTFGPKPEYPQIAKISHTQGTVELKAIIAKDGTIQELKVVSGSPLLVNAAVDAVSRWRYQPTLLNGNPVEVVTDIYVNFVLTEQ
jgi:protein TonB